MKTFRFIPLLFIGGIALLGCTRASKTSSVQLSIPIENLSVIRTASTTPPPPPLQTLIVNVQSSSAPTKVQSIDFHNSTAPAVVALTIPDITSGDSILVQVLAVYAASGGTMELRYDERAMVLSGDTAVTITPTSIGGATKQSYIAGRIKLAGVYPHGTLLAKITPRVGSPPMTVDEAPIVGGWFRIFAVDGANVAFDYVLKETGLPVFSGLNSGPPGTCSATSVAGGCPYDVSGNSGHRVKFHKPKTYSRANHSTTAGTTRTNGVTEYVVGFFGDLATGSYNVCHANDISEGVPGEYAIADMTQATPTPFATPIDIDISASGIGVSAPSLTAIQKIDGGIAQTSAALYTGSGSAVCSAASHTSGNALTVYHHLLGRDDHEFAGFRPPYQMLKPFASWNRYVDVTQSGGNETIKWKVLPGLVGSGTSSWTSGVATLSSSTQIPVGSIVTGTGIPAETYVSATSGSGPYTLTLSKAPTGTSSGTFYYSQFIDGYEVWGRYSMRVSGDITTTSTVITNIAAGSGIKVGMPVQGQGIPAGAVVSGIDTVNSTVTMSAAATQTATGRTFDFNNSINSSSGGGTNDCTKLAGLGYEQAANSPRTIAATDLTVTGIGNATVSGGLASFQYAVCTYRMVNGSKVYIGEYERGQYSNMPANLSSNTPFGWAHSSATHAVSTNDYFSSALGSTTDKITAISVQANYTILTVTSGTGFPVNSEVMIAVMENAVSGGCGSHAQPGMYDFARVVKNGTTSVYLPSGTWADSLPAAPGANCTLQLVQVPHYKDLTISAFLNVDSYSSTAGTGGIGAFRVSGTLTIDAAKGISAQGVGYAPGNASNIFGGGVMGPSGPSYINFNTGGKSNSGEAGSGGASCGNGASSATIAGAIGICGSGGSSDLLLLGGGGGAGSTGSDQGGTGGAAMYVAANAVRVGAGAYLNADGNAGSVSTSEGGGGAGGSVKMIASTIKPLSASGSLTVSAVGGSSATGGGGGGGFSSVQACSLDSTNVSFVSSVAGGAGVGALAVASTAGLTSDIFAPAQLHWCR